MNPGQEQWRIFFEMAKRWGDVVNRHGGDVTVVHLPEIGIRGNTHFPMSGPQQRRDCGSSVEVPFGKEAGLSNFRLLD
jgi:hypothetical protein